MMNSWFSRLAYRAKVGLSILIFSSALVFNNRLKELEFTRQDQWLEFVKC